MTALQSPSKAERDVVDKGVCAVVLSGDAVLTSGCPVPFDERSRVCAVACACTSCSDDNYRDLCMIC
jgi:hypothetical protein